MPQLSRSVSLLAARLAGLRPACLWGTWHMLGLRWLLSVLGIVGTALLLMLLAWAMTAGLPVSRPGSSNNGVPSHMLQVCWLLGHHWLQTCGCVTVCGQQQPRQC